LTVTDIKRQSFNPRNSRVARQRLTWLNLARHPQDSSGRTLTQPKLITPLSEEKMARRYIELSTLFSTADTESPVGIAFQKDTLEVSFTACGGKRVLVVFEEVRAFRWDDAFVGEVAPCPDRASLVEGSEWLLERIGSSKKHQHFILGFNAVGQFLEVIASSMNAKTA
jgi:hypothetical protein